MTKGIPIKGVLFDMDGTLTVPVLDFAGKSRQYFLNYINNMYNIIHALLVACKVTRLLKKYFNFGSSFSCVIYSADHNTVD